MKEWLKYVVIVLSFALYSCTSIFMRYAASYSFLSWPYIVMLCGAIVILGVYAIIWQQIIKHMEISTAYMFKGCSLIFTMLYAWILFAEQITPNNIIGACVIIIGIALYAKE